ncbi:hypothetical protein MYAM1_002442 [Malassezia yamatoensis]|uniref:PROP1-like PPR domain-containing protein n=1 Tax=Malassezia yamatoensis TaxID=253288 RepID=A0AAJ5YXZ8_9BASI|nr:hypothetical protein MYAM1_002442 [Malassezia yamatoensis]
MPLFAKLAVHLAKLIDDDDRLPIDTSLGAKADRAESKQYGEAAAYHPTGAISGQRALTTFSTRSAMRKSKSAAPLGTLSKSSANNHDRKDLALRFKQTQQPSYWLLEKSYTRGARLHSEASFVLDRLDLADAPSKSHASKDLPQTMRRNSIGGPKPDTPTRSTFGNLTPRPVQGAKELSAAEAQWTTALDKAVREGDKTKIYASLEKFRDLPRDARSVTGFNRVLSALRDAHMPLSLMIAVYEDMLEFGPPPNQLTYSTMIDALCSYILHPSADQQTEVSDLDYLALALEIGQAAHQLHFFLPNIAAYNRVLACCAQAGRSYEAVQVLSMLEENVLVTKDADSYRFLIETFATASKTCSDQNLLMERQARCLDACKLVFETFVRVSHAMAVIQPKNSAFSLQRRKHVWNAMLDAYFTLGDEAGAVALFEKLIASQPAKNDLVQIDQEIASTMVSGFLRAGDVRGAVRWVHQLHVSKLAQPYNSVLESVLNTTLKESKSNADQLLCPIAEGLATQEPLSIDLASRCVQFLAMSLASRKISKRFGTEEAEAYLATLQRLAQRVFDAFVVAKHPFSNPVQACAISAVLQLIGELALAGYAKGAASLFAITIPMLRNADPVSPAYVSLMREASHLPMAIADAAVQHSNSLSDTCVRLKTMAVLVSPAMHGMQGPLVDAYHASVVRLCEAASRDLHGDLKVLRLDDEAWQSIINAYCAKGSITMTDCDDRACEGIARLLKDLSRLPTSGKAAGKRPNLDLASLHDTLAAKFGPELATVWLEPWHKSRDDTNESFASSWGRAESSASANAQQCKAPNSTDNAMERAHLESFPPILPSHKQNGSNVERDEDMTSGASSMMSTKEPTLRFSSPKHASQQIPHAYCDGIISPSLPPLRSFDASLSNALQSMARAHGQLQAEEIYEQLCASIQNGVYATPSAIAVLMNAFGRLSQVDRIDALYSVGMHVLACKTHDRSWRVLHWVQLEDGMMTALSHAKLGDRAIGHRERLLAAGQVPSASAYAALIATIQERTDDAVVAEQLFSESQRLGVRPSTYLYNTVISKLSRARKAEQALKLFDAMRGANLRPSSVTYGAAINACVRTGDEARATQLFVEMEAQPTFQPRVPPYNTMIQYYVHSQMDRDKALFYYEKMQQTGVRPSAHTYKLLLDVWGCISPVQPDRQQAVFARLVADRLVGVQGTHWASLLHTQGTVLRDLDRALEIFESIAEHAPGPRNGVSTVPDAVVYESLFSVFVAHGRTDLMPAYLARMTNQGILPTAYIANLLIKGYAQDGALGLVEARRVFEAMIDPPAGVAAAGNHLPRRHGAGALGLHRERNVEGSRKHSIDRANLLGALVNREPSTYEAMIRAELSYGNHDQALALFDRMKARAFPAALLNRARTMFDHLPQRPSA